MKAITILASTVLLCATSAAWALTSATGGNTVTPLRTGEVLNQKRLELIQGATKFIYIKTFIINRDPSEAPVYEALCARAKEGVDVRMLVDDIGRRQGGNPIKMKKGPFSIAWFKSCGILFERYAKPSWGPIDFALYNQHDKLLVSEKEGIIGGTNYSRDYSAHGQFSKKWYDFDVALTGPSTCALQDIFKTSWVRAYEQELVGIKRLSTKKRRRKLLERYSPATVNTDCQAPAGGTEDVSIIWNDPKFSKERPFVDYVVESLDKVMALESDRVVRLYAPYFIPNKVVLRKLVEAAKAGVKIQIITNSDTSIDPEAFQAYVAMLMRVKPLLDAKVEILLWSPAKFKKLEKDNVFHKKGGCFARLNCFVGSHNLDVRGDKYSSELMAVLSTEELVAERIESYEDDVKYTVPLTEESRRALLKSSKITDRLIAKLVGWAM